MFGWFKRSRELVLAEADEFMESFGNEAYSEARSQARKVREAGDHKRDRFLSQVSKEIAQRIDFKIGLDTATRYVDDQAPYDPGTGIVRKRPDDATLQ